MGKQFLGRDTSMSDTNKHGKSKLEIVYPVIQESDIILEILDARFIDESRNPAIEEKIKAKNKKIVYILNKSDLVDMEKARNRAELLGLSPYIFFSSKDRTGVSRLRNKIKIEARRLHKPLIGGKFGDIIKIGVIGYPNTGKSSIINLLIGKQVARVSPVAGFTKGMQKLKLAEGLMLLDTPGIFPEKENIVLFQNIKKHVLFSAQTWDKIKAPEMIVAELTKKYPGTLEKYYNIPADGDSEVLIEEYGKQKHLLKKHGLVDKDRAARLIIRAWQNGDIKFE